MCHRIEFALPIFDKLKKPNLSEKEEKAVKQIAQELLKKIQFALSQGINWINQESNKAKLMEVLNSEIILTENLSWETFNYNDRKEKADSIFDYVLTHTDLIMNRQMYS
jgi:type I restriction enzyme R subunit